MPCGSAAGRLGRVKYLIFALLVMPGIYVHRIVLNATPEKRIEKRTITEKAGV